MTDVVITGMGATTPLGGDLASTWAGLIAGRSGIVAITEAWAEPLAVRIAGVCAVDPAVKIDRVKARRLDRSTQVGLVAAEEAWLHAGLGLGEANTVDHDRLAVCFGSGIGGLHSTLSNWDAMVDKGARRVSPYTIPMLMTNAPAANIGLLLGARAAVRTTVSACASANDAIALAVDEIRLGRADVVLAGGSEATILPLPIAAFSQMRRSASATTTRPRRPARGTRGATASSSPRAPPRWCWSRWSTHWRAAPPSTGRSPAPASVPTATTSSSRTRRAAASPPPCGRRSRTPG